MTGKTLGLCVAGSLVLAGGLMSVPEGAAAPPQSSVSPVYRLPPPQTADKLVPGASSRLLRTDHGLVMTFQTSGLDAGAAYTTWWVVFNDPAGCSGGCGVDDLEAGRGGSTAVFAAGHVLGGNGVGNFTGYLAVDDPPADPRQILHGDGRLTNPSGAEVHLVARSHGEPLAGMGLVDEQMSTFGGGCMPATDPTGLGPEGPNACANRQVSIHLPPQ